MVILMVKLMVLIVRGAIKVIIIVGGDYDGRRCDIESDTSDRFLQDKNSGAAYTLLNFINNLFCFCREFS